MGDFEQLADPRRDFGRLGVGADTLVSTLRGLDSGSLVATAQPDEGITHAPMLARSEGSVDFDRPAQRVHDRIRGLHPWPGVAVEWQGQRLKLSGSQVRDLEGAAGEILAVDEGIVVGCASGSVWSGAPSSRKATTWSRAISRCSIR